MQNENFTTIRTNVKPLSQEYEIKLDRDLTAPEHFHEELETIRVATEADVVILRLSTDGGRADTMKAFLKVINTSPAYFIADVQGDIASAGGPIMLACDEVQLGEFSSLMIHTVQTGYGGAGHNMKKFSDHTAKDARNIIETCYKGFITQEEIEKVLVGEEMWMDCDEIVSRMAARELYKKEQLPTISEDELNLEFEALYEQITGVSTSLNISVEQALIRLEGMLPELESSKEATLNEDGYSFVHMAGIENDSYSPAFLEVASDGLLVDEHGDIGSFLEEGNIINTPRGYYLACAKILDVKHAHNISIEKLAQKLDDKVKEIVADLNN